MTNKERLEEIKEWFNTDEELHEFQIEWLIEQAEKAEQYEKALDDIKNLSTLNEYADADINGLLNACFQTANKVRPYKF